MTELMRAILEDTAARSDQAIDLVASQVAAEFDPWASESEL